MTAEGVITRLPRGEELSGEELNAVASSHPSRLIVIGGEPAAGKTTLLTAFYERFRVAPFGGFIFAGSRTLPAFEKRCHLSRVASGRATPETERTSAGKLSFLHLAVVAENDNSRYDLLLSDVSGEDFAAARDSTADARRLEIISIAARFALLLDAAALQDPKLRQVVDSNARLLLRSLLEAGVLSSKSVIDLVLTKTDTLNAGDTSRLQFIDRVLAGIEKDFGGRFRELRTTRIAARPVSGSSPLNLEALLGLWCAPEGIVPAHFKPPVDALVSPFDRFSPRTSDRGDGEK